MVENFKKFILITINEIRVNFAEFQNLAIVFGLPVVFTIILGLGLGGGGGTARLRLDVVDQDSSDLSERLIAALRTTGGENIVVCELAAPEQPEFCGIPEEMADPDALATQRIEDQTSYAAVVIPEGFGDTLLRGEDAQIAYRANPELQAPEIVQQTVDAAIGRVGGAVVAARTSVGAAQAADVLGEKAPDTFFGEVYAEAEAQWEQPPVALSVSRTVQEEGANTASGFSQSAPGMATMFVMTFVLGISSSVLTAKRHWTFQRMMTIAVPRWVYMAGKMAAFYLLGLAQFAIVLGLGAALGVNYGDLFAAVLIALVYTLTCTAMGLMFATFAQNVGQASAFQNLIAVVLAPLGGAWWPREITPQFMNVIGDSVSPIAWAMDGFQAIIYYDKGWMDVLPYLGVLLIYAAAFFAIGLMRFRYD